MGNSSGRGRRVRRRAGGYLGVILIWVLVTSAAGGAAPEEQGEPGASRASVTIAAVGDIMTGSDYPGPELPPEDGKHLFAAVQEVFKRADVAFGNLEGPLCEGGVCTKDIDNPNVFAFRMPTRVAALLKDAGLTVVSLANNHTGDFGLYGMASTQRALEAAGLKYAGKDGGVARLVVRGVKMAVLALTYGPPPRSIIYPSGPLAEIEQLAREHDIVIVSIHGGAEGRSYQHVEAGPEFFLGEARGDLVKFSHAAIDRGADLILGHGPYVPRALELYKQRLIAYSLGNFCTYKGMSLVGESGYAPLLWAELNRQGEFAGGRIVSFIQPKPGGPKKDAQGRAARVIRTLSLEDFPATCPLITTGGEVLPGAGSSPTKTAMEAGEGQTCLPADPANTAGPQTE